MKAFFVMMIVAGLVSGAAGQPLDTAENVAKKTAEKTKEAAQTVAHGVKKAANKVEDALTPDPDARRVDVTVNDGEVNMSSDLEPGKTAFVCHDELSDHRWKHRSQVCYSTGSGRNQSPACDTQTWCALHRLFDKHR